VVTSGSTAVPDVDRLFDESSPSPPARQWCGRRARGSARSRRATHGCYEDVRTWRSSRGDRGEASSAPAALELGVSGAEATVRDSHLNRIKARGPL
jgi:hypothetical protein